MQTVVSGLDCDWCYQTPTINYSTYNLGLQIEPWEGRYIGFTYNWGKIDVIEFLSPSQAVEFPQKTLYGCGLTFGIDTPIGPMQYIIMKNSDEKEILTHVSIGWWFWMKNKESRIKIFEVS